MCLWVVVGGPIPSVRIALYSFLIWIGPVMSPFSKSSCDFIRKDKVMLSVISEGHFCRGPFFKQPCNIRDTASIHTVPHCCGCRQRSELF